MQTQDNKINSVDNNRKTNKKRLIFLVFLALVLSVCAFLFKDKIFTFQTENKDITLNKNTVLPKDSTKESETNYFEKKENTEPADFILDKFDKANDAKRKSSLKEISIALMMYFDDNGKYPSSIDGVRLNDKNPAIYKELLVYLTEESLKDPKDPEFYYTYKSDGSFYELSARLENLEDKECKIINNLCIYTIDSRGNVSGK